MYRLVLTPEARDEMEQELMYSKNKWGISHARRYNAEIRQKMRTICRNPYIFSAFSDILPDIHIATHKGNRIIYLIDESKKEVTILGFLSVHQDITTESLAKRRKESC